uniref:Uncharacterized protein n=1 Tax=Panagrolaimus sp. PS1159 TaxID=55785 RepID=A0AC35FNY4_9BILA
MGWLSKMFSSGSSEKKAADAARKKVSGEQAPPNDEGEGQEHGVAGKGYVETK